MFPGAMSFYDEFAQPSVPEMFNYLLHISPNLFVSMNEVARCQNGVTFWI
jgi:hypothetical protein